MPNEINKKSTEIRYKTVAIIDDINHHNARSIVAKDSNKLIRIRKIPITFL